MSAKEPEKVLVTMQILRSELAALIGEVTQYLTAPSSSGGLTHRIREMLKELTEALRRADNRSRRTDRRRHHRGFAILDAAPSEVKLQVKDWKIAGLGYQEISELLKEEGIDVGHTAVWRWIARRRNELERIKTAQEKAEMMAKYLVPKDSDIETGAVILAQALLMEALVDAQPLQVTSIEDLTKVAHAIGRTQASKVQREKWEQDKGQRIKDAVASLKASIQAEVARDDELQQRLLGLVDEAAETMMENVA